MNSETAPSPIPTVAMGRIQSHLSSFAENVSGVRAAVIASVDGFALAEVTGASGTGQRLAAMTSSMLALGGAIGRELALGELEVLMIETLHGKVLMRAIPTPVPLLLMAACDHKSVVGNVLWHAKSCSRQIETALGHCAPGS